ncbi:alpha/beta hydrolase [Mucilaginibacter sp. PAMB04274]|uniref:alpha/beta fold hydrolase n=1 Tax=Mucilaginibacter sp. PAMB04274 TaxID=3138568 RepID=UPI0031F70A3E
MIYHASTNLLDIAYHEMGSSEKTVLLLLHGWPDDATTWEKVMPVLMAAGYRAIAPYLRGFGETKFHDADTPRTGNSGIHAMDMIGLMDSLKIGSFSVIGHASTERIVPCKFE